MSDQENPTPPEANGAQGDKTSPTSERLTRHFHVAGDQVYKATADLPDDQRSQIRWFHAYCVEKDVSLAEAGRLLSYDSSTMHRVFSGKYSGSMENVCHQIAIFRKLEDARNKGRKLSFIHTALSQRIFDLCDAALTYQRVAFIFGDTQIGKTSALRKYQEEHNHGSTVYVSMPTGGCINDFLPALAEKLKMSPHLKSRDARRRIIQSFDDRMLLIVDELHQCVLTNAPAIRTLEFIREIFDASGCGLVLCATNIFRKEVESGRITAVFKQSMRRRLAVLQLPNVSTRKDLNAFAAAYGLEPATDDALRLQTDMNIEEGLGMWLTLLRMGAKVATTKNKKMTWNHVIEAHKGLKALAAMPADER